MDGYIKKSEAVDVIVKYPYNIAGKTATAIKMIEDLPSADVVPKSEVDKMLIGEVTSLAAKIMIEEQEARHKVLMTEHDRKLASEIFAEIERIILDNTYPDFNREHKPVNIWKAKTGYDALDELKKKYTE